MTGISIKTYPSPVLRRKCKSVCPDSPECAKLGDILQEMLLAMYANKGVGLAAPQIGVDKQIMVVDVGEGPLKLINPVITGRVGEESVDEGCLSLPGLFVCVKRASEVSVSALDEHMQPCKLEADGLLARVIQHEVDHLSGVLIIDYLNPVKRFIATRKTLAKKKRG